MTQAKSPFMDTFEIPPYMDGLLSGLSFAVKDLIDIAGMVTGCGNPSWAKSHPKAAVHAVCIEQLLGGGATCVGKTISDELAFSLLGENYFYGTPVNPTAEGRVPGGSSSGSASAVALGLVDFAIGTDTGGSVRVPASNCQIFGFRPSHGRISVAGVNAFALSFDTVGAFARDLDTLEKVMEVLLGEAKSEAFEPSIFQLDEAIERCDAEIQKSFRFDFPSKQLPQIDLLDTFSQIQWSEIWSSLGAWIEAEDPEFGPRTKGNFHLAKTAKRKDLFSLIKTREQFTKEVNQMIGNGFLLFPTTTSIPPKLGEIGGRQKTGSYYPRLLTQTSLAGLAGLPQLSFPIGGPVGLSLVASHGNDMALFQAVRGLLKTRAGDLPAHISD